MKIATYNVNGVNGRLPVLLRWLKESKPDIVCLQELKAPNEKFPVGPLMMQDTTQYGMVRKAGTV
jgi:exodeoxyribonuclease-3